MISKCVIGEYTRTGWDKDLCSVAHTTADECAFVFRFTSSCEKEKRIFLSNTKQDEKSVSNALRYDETAYGMVMTNGYSILNPRKYTSKLIVISKHLLQVLLL